ncbi:MAG: hypothetical protein JWN34_1410 [Bryobacterales bacterium]|nr:hypothetical protein [Bryobacterales bacterium]
MLSESFDLSEVLPDETREAVSASETFKLFFVFENYLRDFVLTVLSDVDKDNWWDLIPQHLRDEVKKIEETEGKKKWMNVDARGKLALLTLPQLVLIMEDNALWKAHFEQQVLDKQLLQHTRFIVHTRNTVCHMSTVTVEEHERVKQVMRDWFRVVAP